MANAHSLRRTSPIGERFLGKCVLCQREDLTTAQANDDCPGGREKTRDEVLLEALELMNG